MFETSKKAMPEMFGVHTVTLIPFKATSATSSKEIAVQDVLYLLPKLQLHASRRE